MLWIHPFNSQFPPLPAMEQVWRVPIPDGANLGGPWSCCTGGGECGTISCALLWGDRAEPWVLTAPIATCGERGPRSDGGSQAGGDNGDNQVIV